ncbi:MAG: protein export chaperone SatS [Mycobacterium sp.]
MAAEIVPIKLVLTEGDLFTLWAPRWKEGADEWEAFLGDDEDLYAFESVPDLVGFVRTNNENDLTDHPAWEELTTANAHSLDPDDSHQFDIIGVLEALAEKPTKESVESVKNALAIVSSIGSVCELPAITKFFNGNPRLSGLSAGIEHFEGKPGLKRWDEIATIVGKSWDKVIDAVEEVISTPDVDEKAAGLAEEELAEELEVEETDEEDTDTESEDDAESGEDDEDGDEDGDEDDEDEDEDEDDERDDVVLGTDEDFWHRVGIDPIRVITGTGTFYTLRCYFDDAPIFLGRNGRISVFTSERSLARYLADEHDHDLSTLSTYSDVHTAATDGSLEVEVTDENVYVLTGLADDLTDGPDVVDQDQLDLAVELLRDVGDYSEDDVVDKALDPKQPLGRLVAYILEPKSVSKPKGPYADAVKKWEALERFVESRLRRE